MDAHNNNLRARDPAQYSLDNGDDIIACAGTNKDGGTNGGGGSGNVSLNSSSNGGSTIVGAIAGSRRTEGINSGRPSITASRVGVAQSQNLQQQQTASRVARVQALNSGNMQSPFYRSNGHHGFGKLLLISLVKLIKYLVLFLTLIFINDILNLYYSKR